MNSKSQIEKAAKNATQALGAQPDWAGGKDELELALWLAQRAAESPFIRSSMDPETGSPNPNHLRRQQYASVPSFGWSGLLDVVYGLVDECLEKTQSPFSAWRWQDVKSKFGTLRLSGSPMQPGGAACFNAAQRAGLDLYEIRISQKAPPEALRLANAEITSMGLVGPLVIDAHGRMGLSESDNALAQGLFERQPQINARLLDGLADLAENITERLCESCGCLGRVMGSGWITTSCDECAVQKNTEGTRPVPVMPIAQLALEALRLSIGRAMGKRKSRQKNNLSSIIQAAESLSPVVLLAVQGVDPRRMLPQGKSMVEYADSLCDLIWLEHMGIDPMKYRSGGGKTPLEMLLEINPEEGSYAERWLIERAAGSQSMVVQRKSL